MSIAESLPKIKPPSRVKRRLIESAVEIADDDPESLLFQHTVFCQVGLPYRDPGNHVREWDRKQGVCPSSGRGGKSPPFRYRRVGQAWSAMGSKAAADSAHLNAEALRHGSPEIDVDDSLTGFVKRIRGFDHGREIRMFKDQLGRLSAALVRLAMMHDGRGFQINTQIVTAFDLWFPKDERQRVLWPSTVRLSHEYFESLRKHAVPLDERALAALAHSALALDVYSWLAQRLHRVHPFQPQFISWTAIKTQFGFGYGRMDNFKRHFRLSLQTVLSQYRAARVELDDHGMTLRYSPPPIHGRHTRPNQGRLTGRYGPEKPEVIHALLVAPITRFWSRRHALWSRNPDSRVPIASR